MTTEDHALVHNSLKKYSYWFLRIAILHEINSVVVGICGFTQRFCYFNVLSFNFNVCT